MDTRGSQKRQTPHTSNTHLGEALEDPKQTHFQGRSSHLKAGMAYITSEKKSVHTSEAKKAAATLQCRKTAVHGQTHR